MMILSGFFLDLGFGETLNLLFLHREKIAHFFLSLETFTSLKPAFSESPGINVVHFLHSSDCLGCSVSDRSDSDALFLAALVPVHTNTDREKEI